MRWRTCFEVDGAGHVKLIALWTVDLRQRLGESQKSLLNRFFFAFQRTEKVLPNEVLRAIKDVSDACSVPEKDEELMNTLLLFLRISSPHQNIIQRAKCIEETRYPDHAHWKHFITKIVPEDQPAIYPTVAAWFVFKFLFNPTVGEAIAIRKQRQSMTFFILRHLQVN